MADPHTVYHEAKANFEVILLMFMVAGIYFERPAAVRVQNSAQRRSKKILSLLFLVTAVLSHFWMPDGNGGTD